MRISDWSSDVCSSDLKGLRQALGLRLLGKAEVDAPLAAVAQQVAEQMLLVRRGDNEDVADARHHQHRQRVIDQRFIVDRQERLAPRQEHRKNGAWGKSVYVTGLLVGGSTSTKKKI